MASPSLDDILAEVDNCFREKFQQPPISHDVACYNQAYAANANLKERLTVLISGKPTPAPQPAAEPATEEAASAASSKAKPPSTEG